PICTVAVWADGFHGFASVHLDTPAHSAAFVKRVLKNGPAWYGEDREGRFCDSPCDFPHRLAEFHFPGYPDLYRVEGDEPVDYITLEGIRERAEADEGNKGKNRIVFAFLKVVLADLQPFPYLSWAAPFRVGVRMLDSRCEEFWLVSIQGSRS